MLHDQQSLGKPEALVLIRSCFVDLARAADLPFIPPSDRPDVDIDEQRSLSKSHIEGLAAQLASSGFAEGPAGGQVTLLRAEGVALESLAPRSRVDVVSGLTRALIEQQRLFQFRLDEGLLPYTAVDPAFHEMSQTPAVESGTAPQMAPGLPVGELVEPFLESHEASWTAKTLRARRGQLALLSDHLGGSLPAASAVTTDLIRDFRVGVIRLRRGGGKKGTLQFSARQTDDPGLRIAPKTVLVLFEAATSLFRWAQSEGYLSANPSAGIQIAATKQARSHKPRRPFRREELETLFGSPLFTGCASACRR